MSPSTGEEFEGEGEAESSLRHAILSSGPSLPERDAARLALLRGRYPSGAYRERTTTSSGRPDAASPVASGRARGARERAPRSELRRFANVDGALVPDPRDQAPRSRRLAARDPGLLARPPSPAAASTGPSEAPVSIPQETVDFTHTWPRSASTS